MLRCIAFILLFVKRLKSLQEANAGGNEETVEHGKVPRQVAEAKK